MQEQNLAIFRSRVRLTLVLIWDRWHRHKRGAAAALSFSPSRSARAGNPDPTDFHPDRKTSQQLCRSNWLDARSGLVVIARSRSRPAMGTTYCIGWRVDDSKA
jgi:hypothetical protein